MTISIESRWSDTILFEGEFESIKHAVVEAVKQRADLHGAYLWDANLQGADLQGANLHGADLQGADLHGANLHGANLHGANLQGADLHGAYLWDADLHGANLHGANLHGADLQGADLHGAYLWGAYLSDEKLKIAPLQILGLRWPILITQKHMQIGYERHTHEEWQAFGCSDISQMGSNAWDWWEEHKGMLLAACKLHREQAEKVQGKTRD